MSGLDSRLRDVHSISLTPRSPLFFGHPGRCLAVVLGKSRNSALPVSIQHISKNLSNQASFRTVTSANFVPMGVLSTQSSNTATRGLGVGAIGRKLTSLIAANFHALTRVSEGDGTDECWIALSLLFCQHSSRDSLPLP